MKRLLTLFVAGCMGLAMSGAHAGAATPSEAERAEMALDGARWIAKQQRSNGNLFSDKTRADITAEALGAMVAGGVTNDAVDDALAYIRKNGKAAATRGAYTGRIVAGLVAAGADPTDHGGVDYVEILDSQRDGGAYDDSQFFDNLLATNGALAAGKTLDAATIGYIRSNECPDGGFGFENDCGVGADVDSSAWAINVLVAAGRKSDPMVSRARAYIATQQHEDGGFGFTDDKPTGTDSTALVVAALNALGESATSAPWQRSGGNPLTVLEKLQTSAGGFRSTAGASSPNAMSTVNAVPPLAGESYPLPKGPARPQQDADRSDPDGDDDAEADPDSEDGGSAARAGAPTPSPTPRRTGRAGVSVDMADERPSRPRATDGGDDSSFAAPDASEDDGPNRWLLGGALVASLVSAGTGLWYLRFKR